MIFNDPPGGYIAADRLETTSSILGTPDEQTDLTIMRELGLTDATLGYYQELYGNTSPMCLGLYEFTLEQVYQRALRARSNPSFAMANAMVVLSGAGWTTVTDNTLAAMKYIFYASLVRHHGLPVQVDVDLSDESIIKLLTATTLLIPSVAQQLGQMQQFEEWRQSGQYALRALQNIATTAIQALRTAAAPNMQQPRVQASMHAGLGGRMGLSGGVGAGVLSGSGLSRPGARGLVIGERQPEHKPASLASMSAKARPVLSAPQAPAPRVLSSSRSNVLTMNAPKAISQSSNPRTPAPGPVDEKPQGPTSVLDLATRKGYLTSVIEMTARAEAAKGKSGLTAEQLAKRLTADMIWSPLDIPQLKWAQAVPLPLFDVNSREVLLVPPDQIPGYSNACLITVFKSLDKMNPEDYFSANQIASANLGQPRIRGTNALSDLVSQKPAQRKESPLLKINHVGETPLVVMTASEAMCHARQYSRLTGATVCAQRYFAVDTIPLQEGEIDELENFKGMTSIYDMHVGLSVFAAQQKKKPGNSYLLQTLQARLTSEINEFLKYACGTSIRIDSFMSSDVRQLIKIIMDAKPLIGDALKSMQPTLIANAVRSVNDELLHEVISNFAGDASESLVTKLFGDQGATDTRMATGFVDAGTMVYIDLTAMDMGLPLFAPKLNKRDFYLEIMDDPDTQMTDKKRWVGWMSSLFGPLFTDDQGDHRVTVQLLDGSQFVVRRTGITLSDSARLIFTAL